MFFEATKETFERVKPYLNESGYQFEASDCTIPGEEIIHVHVEILSPNLTQSQIWEINERIDAANREFHRVHNKDVNENGIPDRLEDDEKLVEVRKRPWDEKLHTPKQEALGYLTGEAQEEEVTYEYR